ncbi:MAG: PEP-CTERM system TPR-repeat protein PrsT [Alteromonadaceae bacterium]
MKFLKLLLVIGLINGIVACSENETASTHINKAKIYTDERKFDESIIELKNAIQKSPDNNEARFMLGKLYLQQGSGFEAVKELEKAHKLKYTSAKVIPLLARAYLLVNADDDVIELNEQALQLPDEVKSQYLAYNTLANIRVQDNDSAKKSELLANDLIAMTTYSHLASAYILLSENKPEAAKAKVKMSLDISPKNPESIMLLGQINTALGLFSEASENYLEYSDLQPKSSMIILLLTDSSLKEKNYENAEKYADIILSNIPNQPFAHYAKSFARFEVQDYEKASKHAEKAESSGLNMPHLKLIAGASAYYLRNFEQSYHHLSAIIKYLPAEHPALKMYAISQLQLGLISDISETLENFNVANKEDIKFLSTLSLQLAEIGALDDAKKLAEKVTSQQPENAEENVRTGILKMMLNDPSGLTDLENAMSLKPDFLSAELALVSAALQVNDFDKAIEISKDWQTKYPEKPGAFNVLAMVYLKQGKLDLAKTVLNKSLSLLAENQFAITHLINIALKRNDIPEATRLSKLGLGYFPEGEKMLKLHYAASRGDIEKRDLASEKIRKIYRAKTDNLTLGLLYAEVLLDQSKYKQALTILESFKTSIHSPNRLWQLKLFALRNIDEGKSTTTVLETWMKTNPYAPEPALLLIDYYLRDKNLASALRIVNKALKNGNKNNVMLKVSKMQILLDKAELEEVKSFYPEFTRNNMHEKIVQGINGRIYLLEKNYKQAIPLLATFYANFPSRQNILLLAIAQKNDRKVNEAIVSLKTYLETNDSDTQVRSLLANMYLENEPEKAIPLYEKMLKDKPKDVVFLNNLAWLSLENNHLELALKYSAEAIKLAPKHPSVLDTRGMVLLKAGEKTIALKALTSAYKFSKGSDVNITLNYAEVLISNEKNKDALTILNKLNSNDSKQEQRKKSLITLAN